MVREYYEAVRAGQDVRANLIRLRDALKEEKDRRAFAYLLGGDFSALSRLLKNEDPKVRRNAALILGKMESEDLLPVLFDAYERENTRFVRADYLRAISELDYQELVGRLESHLARLRSREVLPEEQKHVAEEIRTLQAMVLKYRKPEPHRFEGYHSQREMILVTNRCQREATARQIKKGTVTMLGGGLRIRGAQVGDVLGIRTWSELLFPLASQSIRLSEPEKVGEKLLRAGLNGVMEELHAGEPPYYFRIELKGRTERDKRGDYIRKLSDSLERASGGSWINSTTSYEAELRLLEKKDGSFAAMLKLYTLPDRRFAYRQEVIASSISPVNAALAVELARPYLREGAQVLDPFCGVGTMLVERAKALPAGAMYGVDIFGEAIDKAWINTERSGCRAWYVNRDFFDFTHEYLFDEIITDLPQVTPSRGEREIRQLYGRFFEKASVHLKKDGVMVLYSTEGQTAAEEGRKRPEYKIEERFPINEKTGTEVLIFRFRG